MKKPEPIQPIAINIRDVALLLGCGQTPARKIADSANAKIHIKGRKVLYSRKKILDYINS